MTTNNCTDIRLALVDLLGDGASQETRAAVEAHLSGCAACADEFRELSQVWQELPATVDVRPPPALRQRVLARALAVVAGAVFRSWAPRPVRAVLVGALGALGGYAVLSLVLPISATFGLCRVLLFGEQAMSLGQVCVVYLVIAAAYAGVPLSIAVYAWPRSDPRWRTGLVEAAVFAGLAAPLLVLQVGLDQLMITGTVLAGLVIGALVGGLAGTWARGRLALPMRA